MSARIDQLCDDLKQRLNAIDSSLQRAKASLVATPAKAGQAIQDKLDQARRRMNARKAQVRDTRAKTKSKLRQDLAEAKGRIEKWKANHDAEKLARHADRAEEYAEYAMLDAIDAVNDAEVAALQAIQAGLAAEAAAAALPTPA